MAQVDNFRMEYRWRGLASGMWYIFDLSLNHAECAGGVVALSAAIAAVLVEVPPPINVIAAAMIVAKGHELLDPQGPNGVAAHIEMVTGALVPAVEISNAHPS